VRNTRIRAVLVGRAYEEGSAPIRRTSYSASVPVFVEPMFGSTLTRPDNGPVLQFDFLAYVHRLPSRYRAEVVYFYVGARTARTLQRVGSRRLRYSETVQPELTAVFDYRDPDGVQMVACVRRPLVADMGYPFDDRACGRPTIAE
jgi:hypothetical protein